MSIVQIEGNVKYTITLDPGVWIFDDRKIELKTFLNKKDDNTNQDPLSIKAFSDAWERETSLAPPVEKSIKKFEKEKVLTESYGIPFLPFLTNAEPNQEASKLIIDTGKTETYVIPLDQAKEAILGFSKEGKPLLEDGPIHFYFGDGSNKDNPITHVKRFIIK